MPKMGVFTMEGPHEGKTVTILEKYPFTNGVFKTPARFAPLMAAMLCQFYGAVLTYEGSDDAHEADSEDDGSLSVAKTRGLSEGQKMAAHDEATKLENAAKIAADEAALVEKRKIEAAEADKKAAAAAVKK